MDNDGPMFVAHHHADLGGRREQSKSTSERNVCKGGKERCKKTSCKVLGPNDIPFHFAMFFLLLALFLAFSRPI